MNNYKTRKLTATIHSHTLHSLKDGVASIEGCIHRIFELGGLAFFMSDHGTLTGFEDLRTVVEQYRSVINACKKNDCQNCQFGKLCNFDFTSCSYKKYADVYNKTNTTIKGIPCVEAYFADDSLFVKRAHLLLIPKDNTGFKALSKAVTESNKNMDSQGFPLMTTNILQKYFGEGSIGHNHIIASSACESGILASVFLANNLITKQIDKEMNKLQGLTSPNDEEYKELLMSLEDIDNRIASLNEEIKRTDKLAKQPFKKKINAVEKMKNTPDYKELKKKLDSEMAEAEQAKVNVVALKKSRDDLKAKRKTIKEAFSVKEKAVDKWYKLSEQILKMQETLSSDEDLYEQAKKMANMFIDIFGTNNFYAELQYHRRKQEAKAMPLIAKLAKELNLPLVATNDSHMVAYTEEEMKKRQIMRSLRFNKWEDMEESDKELFIKTDEELSSILKEILPEDVVNKAMQGIVDITNVCNVEYSYESHFPKFDSPVHGESADEALRRMAIEGIAWRFPNRDDWTEEHQKRLEYELDVIKTMGYSDYHCIVADFLNYGRIIGKLDLASEEFLSNPFDIEKLRKLAENEVGEGIGPGRGSAVGSLVCYLTGITSVNPMAFGLLFERFLNVERVSMPDIDSDFAPEVREWCLEYVKHIYGVESVCCIMTRGTQKAKAAIRNCARLLGSELYNDTRAYLDLGDSIAKAVPNTIGITLSECWDDLIEKFKDNPAAITILNNAKLVEGMFTNVGMHAAGVIIADKHPVDDYIPLLYLSGRNQMASQCDKEQCEARGMLKMDFLGLKNLGVITDALKLIQKNYGINIDIEKVPFEEKVFAKIFAEGNTNSVFQFESGGMKQMLRQFKPSSIEDIILLVAAYRPGPMQYLDEIIAVKHGAKQPEYIIPEMAEILSATYGKPIYQEQIMQIFNKFAGFSLGESDIIRRYMSKKKTEKFMAYKDKFVAGMIERGGTPADVERFWNELLDFSKYAFNKSHAGAYAFVAYYTAWLKTYYPKEYMCAVMNYTAFDKLNALVGDCRMFNLEVLPPDINRSLTDFSTTENGILYGFGSIKDVGKDAANQIVEERKNGFFTSLADFCLRTKARADVIRALINAGAFDTFDNSRTYMLHLVPEYLDFMKKVKDKENKLEKETNEEKRESLTSAINEFKKQINNITVARIDDEMLPRLLDEKNSIGAFLSAHPLDNYPVPEECNCTSIAKLGPKSNCNIMGIITNLRVTNRKSDNKPMAFFTLEDKTGTINVACFTEKFAEFGNLIKEDAVVQIKGDVKEEENEFEDSVELQLKLVVQSVKIASAKKERIIIKVASFGEYSRLQKEFLSCRDDAGDEMLIYFEDIGQLRKFSYKINKEKINKIIK